MAVRLLVRERSGRWRVDQGFMTKAVADQRKREWNRFGYGCLILKHGLNPGLKIVARPATRFPMGFWNR